MSDTALFETDRLTLVAATPDHAPELQEVFEAAGDHFLTITGRPEPEPDAALREIDASARTPGRMVALLRVDGGDAVGALGAWLHHPEKGLALVGMLVVRRDRRREGLAREALDGFALWAAGQGVRALRTATGAGDAGAQDIVRALGFRPLDERTHIGLDRGRIMIALFERPTVSADDTPAETSS
jgi:GNAT superfamily N-acetyltransferase